MKIAVISDIHGNIAALNAVLADASMQGVDQIVNLGDILSGSLFPAETADLLMAMALPTIRGNHERQVLDSLTYGRSTLAAGIHRRKARVMRIHFSPGYRIISAPSAKAKGTEKPT